MDTSVEVGRTGDLPEGGMKEVLAEGRKILLARVEGKFYAADNICPHMGGRLGLGRLEGTVVTCPRHGSQFELRDGHVVRWAQVPAIILLVSKVLSPPRPIGTYRVDVDGDKIMVAIPV